MKTMVSLSAVMLMLGMLAFQGCATNAQTGAAVGAGGGAVAGQAIGGNTKGTLIGAGVGAIGGYLIGNEADKAQAARERDAAYEQANTYIVNVHNSNGSITLVTLRRAGPVWVGPRNEQYSTLPTEEQLRPLYGF